MSAWRLSRRWPLVKSRTDVLNFLIAVNGANDRRVYDGTSWSTSPAITGVASASLSHVWVFKNRLFFIEKDTMNAWCLAIDAIGGAATKISLSGVFKKGGSLLFGETWSIDAGDGLGERCAASARRATWPRLIRPVEWPTTCFAQSMWTARTRICCYPNC